jgi:broad specificity phosphatase PhoE
MITVLLVRHADVDVPPPIGNPDPSLNTKGMIRAHELARVAEVAGVSAIFTSELKRTKETAAPLAARLQLARPPSVVPDVTEFAASARAGLYGPVVLVVGHTNTVPPLIDALVSPQPSITIQGFDNLFVVSLAAMESQLVWLKYGPPSD